MTYIIVTYYIYTYVILYTYYNLNVPNIIPVLIAVIVAVDGGRNATARRFATAPSSPSIFSKPAMQPAMTYGSGFDWTLVT